MDNKRAPDAAEKAPRPPAEERPASSPPPRPKHEEPNDDDRIDGGQAIRNEDLNSANDE